MHALSESARVVYQKLPVSKAVSGKNEVTDHKWRGLFGQHRCKQLVDPFSWVWKVAA